MKIPESFTIFGSKWKVICDAEYLDDGDALGHCALRRNVITIMPPENSRKQSRCDREHSFCHELVHVLLEGAGVSAIEPQVDVMGGLLHQFMETKRGEVE
jgi:hypothetical protein